MRRAGWLLPLLLCCAHARAGSGRLADEAAIARVLADWHDAAARADEDRYFSHFAPGGVFLGTDATERWDAAAFRAFAHPYFAKGKAWTLVPSDRHLEVDGDHAWFDEALATSYGPCRGTGVLQRLGGAWKIAQYNLTLTIPNDRVRAVQDLLAGRAPPPPPGAAAPR